MRGPRPANASEGYSSPNWLRQTVFDFEHKSLRRISEGPCVRKIGRITTGSHGDIDTSIVPGVPECELAGIAEILAGARRFKAELKSN